MAQRCDGRTRRLRLLARRYGVSGKRGAALGCVVLVALLGAFGFLRLSQSTGTVVERSQNDTPSIEAGSGGGRKDKSEGLAKDSQGDGKRTDAASSEVWVHVDGAVNKPGVYKILSSSPRVNDAIDLAGGLSQDANTANVNLAAPLSDGQKVYVPHEGEAEPQSGQATVPESASSDATTLGNGSSADGRVNINTATETELQTLPGVGEATAAAIMEERQSGGPFSSVEDLMRVSGIGEKKFAKVKDKICV
ncbi:MAG: helix-hairpin-helix domain-containing protein [Atopobiaceae bacterium]|nr:helix-hairpin-helix domain-containing protein [Atopobiaceae bacterium]